MKKLIMQMKFATVSKGFPEDRIFFSRVELLYMLNQLDKKDAFNTSLIQFLEIAINEVDKANL